MKWCLILSATFLLFGSGCARPPPDDPKYYLYATEDSKPVIDHHPSEEKDEMPDFLYGANQGPRVVEFYQHSCPHCRHFRTHYVEFARKIDKLTSGRVKCYAISCAANHGLCRKNKVSSFPRIYLYAAGERNFTMQVKYWQLNTTIALEGLGIETVEKLQVKNNTTTAIKVGSKPLVAEKASHKQRSHFVSAWPKTTKQQIHDDIYLSFNFNLRNDIFTSNKALEDDTKLAFKNWLELLRKTVPQTWHMQTIIGSVLENFESAIVSTEHLTNILDTYPHPVLTSESNWSDSCSRGEIGAGFSCGLWQLFHVMTLGVVEHDLKMLDKESQISPVYAADILKDFIANFLHCEDCRLHFMKEYNACAFNRCSRLKAEPLNFDEVIELPIWLSETHNGVTVRLLHEKSDQPVTEAEEVEMEWPANADCPDCWIRRGVYNKPRMYSYLKSIYWPSEDLPVPTIDTNSKVPTGRLQIVPLVCFLVVSTLAFLYLRKFNRRRVQSLKRNSSNGKISV